MRLIQPGAEAVPKGKDSRNVSETLRASYTPNLESPITVTLPAGGSDGSPRACGASTGCAPSARHNRCPAAVR